MKQGIFVMLTLLVIFFFAYDASAESYDYLKISTGKFVDMERGSIEPDGDFIAYIEVGRTYIVGRNEVSLSYLHRSNYDIGWPRARQAGANEYHRNGFFISYKIKFNFLK